MSECICTIPLPSCVFTTLPRRVMFSSTQKYFDRSSVFPETRAQNETREDEIVDCFYFRLRSVNCR